MATDFSLYASAATQLGAWVADRSHGTLTLAHVAKSSHRAPDSPYRAQHESFYGDIDDLDQRILQIADDRLKQTITDLGRPTTRRETLIGEPFVELIHAVQKTGYDLVMTGTRGASAWKQFLIGSTARRLIRKCPSSVWVVKVEHAQPPRTILATTDFSEVSRRAVIEARWIAEQANAELRVLHVIDMHDVPDEMLERKSIQSFRRAMRDAAKQRFDEFLAALPPCPVPIVPVATWGIPWREVARFAKKSAADLVVLGTVGRSGISGLLLGNTADKVLSTCNASILTVKPADFVSPVAPAVGATHLVPNGTSP